MPIVDIETVTDSTTGPDDALVQSLADALGPVLGSRPGGTWVRLRRLPVDRYAESAVDRNVLPRPVFVTILKASLQEADALEAEAAAVAEAVAGVLGRPVENTHVIYEPAAAGRVAFGGTLRR